MDGHVDPHAQGVGAADHGQQALLGELLHEQPVAGEHAGVVDAHAAQQEALQGLAEAGVEALAADGLLHLLALLLGGDPVARERLGAPHGVGLGEVHDVDGGVAVAQGELHGCLERRVHELVGERHRARRVEHAGHLPSRAFLEPGGYGGDVAQGGAHEQELHVRQREQRHQPRPSAVAVAQVVELVHDDAAHVQARALAQGVLGQDLGRAADDGRLGVYDHVAREHAHVLAAE